MYTRGLVDMSQQNKQGVWQSYQFKFSIDIIYQIKRNATLFWYQMYYDNIDSCGHIIII